MYYVYFLKSKKHDWYYVGHTSDLKKRLSLHNSGLVESTKHRRPYDIVYVEELGSVSEARTRERGIKKSRSQKEDIIKHIKALSSNG